MKTLGNSKPNNTKDTPKQFSIAPLELQKPPQPGSNSKTKSLTHEMGLNEDSPEFIACVKLLETIKPKQHKKPQQSTYYHQQKAHEETFITQFTEEDKKINKKDQEDKVQENAETTEEHKKHQEEENSAAKEKQQKLEIYVGKKRQRGSRNRIYSK